MPRPWRLLLWGVGLVSIVLAIYVLTERDEREQSASWAATPEAGPSRAGRPGVVGARPVDRAGLVDELTGQVVDPDGQPVEEGRLVLTCQATGQPLRGVATLGEEGRFRAVGCGGAVCAQLHHPSLIQEEAWLLVPGEAALLHARPLAALHGAVVDPRGVAVAGAKIVLVPEEDDPTAVDAFVSRHATSDDQGEFAYMRVERPPCDACAEQAGRCEGGVANELPLFTGSLLLSVSATGFRVAEATIDAATEGPLEIRLEAPAAALTGTLLDAQGRAYPRARVLLRSHDRRSERQASESDPVDGSFAFEELGEGLYSLQVIHDGLELVTLDDVRAGDRLDVRSPTPSDGTRLELRVVAADGREVDGALVDGGPFHAARTDATGRVAASGVVRGEYRVRASVPNGATVRELIDVPAGEQVHRVEIEIP